MNLTYRVVGAPKNRQKVSLLALVANMKLTEKFNFPKPQCGARISYCFTVNGATLAVVEALRCGRPYPQTPPLPCSLRRWTAVILEQLPL